MAYDMKGVEGLCKSLGGEFEGNSEKNFNCNLEDKAQKKTFWEGAEVYKE